MNIDLRTTLWMRACIEHQTAMISKTAEAWWAAAESWRRLVDACPASELPLDRAIYEQLREHCASKAKEGRS